MEIGRVLEERETFKRTIVEFVGLSQLSLKFDGKIGLREDNGD